jgi:hypothetical protein
MIDLVLLTSSCVVCHPPPSKASDILLSAFVSSDVTLALLVQGVVVTLCTTFVLELWTVGSRWLWRLTTIGSVCPRICGSVFWFSSQFASIHHRFGSTKVHYREWFIIPRTTRRFVDSRLLWLNSTCCCVV